MSSKKRIENELREWNISDKVIWNPGTKSIIWQALGNSILHIPDNYPFEPPRPQPALLREKINACFWAITILSRPELLVVAPSPHIECICCSSITCSNKWNPTFKIRQVILEVDFSERYKLMKRVQCPTLPSELWEHIISFV